MNNQEKPSDVLRDFLYLNSVNTDKPTKGLQDIWMTPDMLFRETGQWCTVWYLRRQGYIKIPVGYLRIFRSLDIYGGEKLLYTDTEGLGKLDLFILGFLKFTRSLDLGMPDLGELFEVLCRLGTAEFRNYLQQELGYKDLGPWIYEEPRKTLNL